MIMYDLGLDWVYVPSHPVPTVVVPVIAWLGIWSITQAPNQEANLGPYWGSIVYGPYLRSTSWLHARKERGARERATEELSGPNLVLGLITSLQASLTSIQPNGRVTTRESQCITSACPR